MLGLHIEIGYNGQGSKDTDWDKLKEVAQNPVGDKLYQEVLAHTKISPEENAIDDCYTLVDFTKTYFNAEYYHMPIFFEDEHCIRIMCSGGGVSRKAKQETAHAFARLLLLEMFKLGTYINISFV